MPQKIRLGVIGDVMIGRAVDRILPDHVNGKIYESSVKHSDRYIDLAERVTGDLPQKEIQEKGHKYIWGDLLHELKNIPDCLIINLETALTTHEVPDPQKGINYRTHPKNVRALKSIGVKVATLANDHALDWNQEGLEETFSTLEQAGILYVGANRNAEKAQQPAFVTLKLRNREPLVDKKTFGEVHLKIAAYGFASAGVPKNWKAGKSKCGINFLSYPTTDNALLVSRHIKQKTIEQVRIVDRPELKVVSLHWGPNWGWEICGDWKIFAHTLIDNGIDVVIGHSSHHIKGIEVYKGKLIAYGLGDFINDYEGIVGQGYEMFRHDLCCLYLPTIDAVKGTLLQLDIIPCKIKHLKVQRATNANDIEWIRQTLCREGSSLNTSCIISKDKHGNRNLRLEWGV